MDSYVVEQSQPSGSWIGRQAVVVGAGIGGLAAAGALSDWFEHVVLIERDAPPEAHAPRSGTPQANHSHGLLAGGLLALDELFPGLAVDLHAVGVPVRLGEGLREELPDGRAMPARDFGMSLYTMSRPLLEHTLYRRVMRRGNITVRHRTSAVSIVADTRRRVSGVLCFVQEGEASGVTPELIAADLVVDATGRGNLTPAFLDAVGCEAPRPSIIGIDINYTTAILPRDEDFPEEWKVVITHNMAPASHRAVMVAIEGGRWILTVAGCGSERPPGDWPGVLAHLRKLSTTTVYNIAKHVRPLAEPVRFGMAQSIWRHYERAQGWPDGLIPLGDAICRFNPVYGQGMSVAAKEARLLHRLLAKSALRPDPIRGLGKAFLDEAKLLIETPWTMAALPDFALPGTRGERPADLQRLLNFRRALRHVAARDPLVHKLTTEVWHMLTPRSVLDDPLLVQRVEAQMEILERSHDPSVTVPDAVTRLFSHWELAGAPV